MSPRKDIVTCIPVSSISSQGIWVGDTPLKFATPTFMAQVAMSAFITGTVDFSLRRYGICSFFSQMVGAIILGGRMLGKTYFFKEYMYSWSSLCILETMQYLGCVFFLFLVGLKMDFRMVNPFGRKARIIGISVGVFPGIFLVCMSRFLHVHSFFQNDESAGNLFNTVAVTQSQTSFHVVVCLLSDLKMLNSEIGRLAVASSMVSNICCWNIMILLVILGSAKRSGMWDGLYMLGTYLSLIFLVIYGLKPITHWMIKQVPQGTNFMKQVHVFMVFLMVLVCELITQFMGHPPGLGPLLLGVVIPPGPPLAETVEDKLESITTLILLPLTYVTITWRLTIIGDENEYRLICVLLICVLAFLAKIIATLVTSICCGITLNNSLVLGLIIASQGFVDLLNYGVALEHKNLTEEVYTSLIYFTVVIAGMTSIMVKVMYKPSVEHLAYSERSLADNTENTEFRILACIYQDYNVPSVIGLLQASNATDESPINLHLVHLLELRRVAPPLLISHKENNRSIYYNRSIHIIKAFRSFVKPYKKRISLHSFSALSPCLTMHQDICSLAVDARVSLIILPFHRQFDVDGIMVTNTTIRNVNSSVLKLSPCSVGILIDQRRINLSSPTCNTIFHTALIFLGGADDREALTYGMRMVQYPNTTLSVIRFSVKNDRNSDKKMLDEELLEEFHRKYKRKKGINYREEDFSDGFGIVKAIRETADYKKIDLIMVGRQHGNESELFNGLSEWNEFPELGLIGDVLVTSNLHHHVSILVLQQKYRISDDLFQRTKYKIHI